LIESGHSNSDENPIITRKNKEIKIVLRGTGESGKSSIFKQIQNLNEDKIIDSEFFLSYKNSIYMNLIQATIILSNYVKNILKENFDDPDNMERVSALIKLGDGYLNDDDLIKIHKIIGELWKENILVKNL
jgi:spore coat protein CotF